MNYGEPESEKINIVLTRLPASGTNRQGALLFNFGGFGGEGIEQLQDRALDGLIPESISETYDLVGFDPRGVGGSSIVDCSKHGAGDENPYPASADQVAELVANYEQVASDCNAQ